jgi:hypothetical protein
MLDELNTVLEDGTGKSLGLQGVHVFVAQNVDPELIAHIPYEDPVADGPGAGVADITGVSEHDARIRKHSNNRAARPQDRGPKKVPRRGVEVIEGPFGGIGIVGPIAGVSTSQSV